MSLCLQHAKVLDYFEREVKYLKYCEEEFEEYQKFQAKTELKLNWRQRDRKQYVILGIKKIFHVSFYLKNAPVLLDRIFHKNQDGHNQNCLAALYFISVVLKNGKDGPTVHVVHFLVK